MLDLLLVGAESGCCGCVQLIGLAQERRDIDGEVQQMVQDVLYRGSRRPGDDLPIVMGKE